jgi:hypothetical protein
VHLRLLQQTQDMIPGSLDRDLPECSLISCPVARANRKPTKLLFVLHCNSLKFALHRDFSGVRASSDGAKDITELKRVLVIVTLLQLNLICHDATVYSGKLLDV